ncbi:MAG: DNA polymerase III subunit alpha [Candidatus Marinimicrobia bacterium]|nr:DNA polymerase III subunit alpha [Candidatus Neomarinimicrobiota bacterium]MBL7022507.1 DNA polymerase III subunit alpha [Candidatus Neomarinimicrobiota bacterium]MBL7108638.1 DNA polymerase III subunit alpha [Candidatus Neomarinimicrobiota bacterium]
MPEFVHLHNHTDFSLQDAAQSVTGLCDRIQELGMTSVAVTEHGNLFSMVPFYREAKKRKIKPIIGCEVYVAAGSRSERKGIPGRSRGYHHLVLLVQNETGYKNLLKLVTQSYLEGFYYKPRVDKELLKKYNEGLIATGACLAGEITHYAAQNDMENAKISALEYAKIFPNRFYIELQNHGIEEEITALPILKKISKELNIPMVATNDCHYALKEHWEAHDILTCLATNKNRSDENRRRYKQEEFYIRSAEEMVELFSDVPEAIENTVKIAESCNFDIPMGTYHLPHFAIPESSDAPDTNEYLKKLCEDSIKNRFPVITSEIKERLKFELEVITKMGFSGYFLIVQDFVQYAKSQNIPVGPGRGSGAGSLVAYITGITNVDPIKYNLLFERFLNPDRISMPDFDIDFCIEGRQKVIDYIKERYGDDSVAQIITFGTMKARSVVRDVARVMGMSYSEGDKIAKMIPNELEMTLKKALKVSKDLTELLEKDDQYKELIKHSKILEGLNRHSATHAAGVVITPGPLTDYVALHKNQASGDVTTQAEMGAVEELGLLKMDFLGLRNLTVIDKTIKMIKENHNVVIDIENLDLEDDKTLELFARGKTIGVFQFESEGMRENLKHLKPSGLADLIAMNALYRPGPMQNIPEFIARKNGQKKIEYLHPLLEPILNETYGIIVYQEQVMQIGSAIGGFSLAQADEMRRAMGKKKADVMAAFKVDFVNGAQEKGVSQKLATEIFDLVEKFAQYGFNKSHSTAYSFVAFQTAWLKVHYPAEFIAANLSSEMSKTERVVHLISEARKMNLSVLPPNVNTSFADFRATKNGDILYGLSAIKNVGQKACEIIANTREKEGIFKTIYDFCKKVDSTSATRKLLESLVLSGACDSLVGHRAQQFEIIEKAQKFGKKAQEEKLSLQSSLFGATGGLDVSEPPLPEVEKWTKEQALANEKELIGFYLSGNPLEKHFEDLKEFNNVVTSKFDFEKLPKEIRLGGIISEIKQLFDKKNNPWVILGLTDLHGKAEVFVFSESYEKLKQYIKEDNLVFVQGSQSTKNGDSTTLKIICETIIPIKEVRSKLSRNINLSIEHTVEDAGIIDTIKEISESNKGSCGLVLHLKDSNGGAKRVKAGKLRVTSSTEFVTKLRSILGDKNVWIS